MNYFSFLAQRNPGMDGEAGRSHSMEELIGRMDLLEVLPGDTAAPAAGSTSPPC